MVLTLTRSVELVPVQCRQVMASRFDKRKYGQRQQVETVNSILKRLSGSALRARIHWSQGREITLRAITLNVMILWRQTRTFLQSKPAPFVRHIVPEEPPPARLLEDGGEVLV